MIFVANRRNINDINKYKHWCCACYYVSLEPLKYGIADDVRFDLSFCIPECTDCKYCDEYFNGNAQDAFDYNHNTTCPISGYSGYNGLIFSWDWDSKTQCGPHISYKSFSFFVKSYTAYGIWSIITSCLYSFGLIALMWYVYTTPNLYIVLLRWILIYNILVSEIFLYLLFKPFQYYHHDLFVGENNKSITCDINSIHDQAANVISVTIYLSITLMFAHFIYIIYSICLYCRICVKSYRRENRMTQDSVGLEEMMKQINYGTDTGNKFNLIKHRCRWGLCPIVVSLLMGFFLGISIYATYKMIEAGHKEYDDWKVTLIALVMTLIFLSLIDNPWLLSKIKQFCFPSKPSKIKNDPEVMLSSVSSKS